ncbi:MAG TPA: hypothetical protein VF331_02975 [Polyangiales bacterium]
MTKRGLRNLGLSLLLAACGCATSFEGSAYVPGERAGCEKKCNAQGLVMGSLVYMGEYSSACVCELPASHAPAAGAAASSAGAVGVIMQMQRSQQQNRNLVAMGMR